MGKLERLTEDAKPCLHKNEQIQCVIMGAFENRRWVTIPLSSTSSVNFGDVLETSTHTLRLSVDGTETFVKYDFYNFQFLKLYIESV